MSTTDKKTKRESHPGDFTLKLISGLLFVGFMLYVAFGLYSTLDNPLRVTRASVVLMLESTTARGYIAREELVIPGAYGLVMPELSNGTRTASGQTVAVGYGSGADSRTIAEASELRSRITMLSSVASTTAASRSTQSRTASSSLAMAVLQNDFAAERRLAIELESLVMSSAETADVRAEIAALQSQLNSLTSQSLVGSGIFAPASGIFATEIDGYESISPKSLSGLVPSGLDALFSVRGGGGAARIVTDTRWSLALVLSDADAARLQESSSVSVRLTSPITADFTMRIEEIGRSQSGERIVVFSCNAGLSYVLDTRTVTAEIMYGEVTGVRVPREAVRLEPLENGELETYVYIAEGQIAKRIKVEILREFGDAYIVRGEVTGENPDEQKGASSAMSRLREGAEIITRANDLFDGKVIR